MSHSMILPAFLISVPWHLGPFGRTIFALAWRSVPLERCLSQSWGPAIATLGSNFDTVISFRRTSMIDCISPDVRLNELWQLHQMISDRHQCDTAQLPALADSTYIWQEEDTETSHRSMRLPSRCEPMPEVTTDPPSCPPSTTSNIRAKARITA